MAKNRYPPSWMDLEYHKVGWPQDQAGWDEAKGHLIVPPCEENLCCITNPVHTCLNCARPLCDNHLDERMGKVPPWEADKYCGTFYL